MRLKNVKIEIIYYFYINTILLYLINIINITFLVVFSGFIFEDVCADSYTLNVLRLYEQIE